MFKNHPFPVAAFFERSIVLSFAIEKEILTPYLPDCFTPDTFNGKYGFIAIALVQTRKLRPANFPEFLGQSFFLIGYRIFVNFTTTKGKRLRGLYIIKSETDSRRMQLLGNIFTHYNYQTTDIHIKSKEDCNIISSRKSGFEIEYKPATEKNPLPPGSPFTDWHQARRFAGPLPFTFTYLPAVNKVLIVEGLRQNWKPLPLEIISYRIPFFDHLKIKTPVLASAFIVSQVPYYWKKGKLASWKS